MKPPRTAFRREFCFDSVTPSDLHRVDSPSLMANNPMVCVSIYIKGGITWTQAKCGSSYSRRHASPSLSTSLVANLSSIHVNRPPRTRPASKIAGLTTWAGGSRGCRKAKAMPSTARATTPVRASTEDAMQGQRNFGICSAAGGLH